MPSQPPQPPMTRVRHRERSVLTRRLVLGLGCSGALLVAALVGGLVTVRAETDGWSGDLTSATLSVSMANEVLGDASCRPDPRRVLRWTCEAYRFDESGNSLTTTYDAIGTDNDCWTATKTGQRGEIESGPWPGEHLSACIHALQRAEKHSLLDAFH